MFKAALIDIDGLLINSEHLYLEANRIYFKKFNFEFTEELHREGTGKKFDKWITTVFPTDKSGEGILKERNVVFFDLARKKLELLDGAKELLTLLRNNFKTALVTSTEMGYIDLIFEKTRIADYFDTLITGDMVSHGKPDPECYKLAADKLNVIAAECLVFEDAPSGILAAKNAGMKVVAVPSSYVKGDAAFKHADMVLPTLLDITLEKIKHLDSR